MLKRGAEVSDVMRQVTSRLPFKTRIVSTVNYGTKILTLGTKIWSLVPEYLKNK